LAPVTHDVPQCLPRHYGVSAFLRKHDRVQFPGWSHTSGIVMSRFRVAMGLLAVVVGTAWWSGALTAMVASVLDMAPFLLLALAVVGGIRAFTPRGVLVGPVVLAVIGVVWLALRFDLVDDWGVRTLGAAMLICGGFMVALTGRRGESAGRSEPMAVRRYRAFAWPRNPEPPKIAPWKLSAAAVLAPKLTVNLTEAVFPEGFPVIEIDVTVVASRIDLVLPDDWKVALGRAHTTAVGFDGEVDLEYPVRYPRDLANRGELWVLVNILGVAGFVSLTKSKAQQ
jgi:hypothetical protein